MSGALRVIGKGNRQRLVFATNGGKALIALPVGPPMQTAPPKGMRGEGPGHGFAGAGTRRTNRQGQGGNATVTTGANRHGTGPSTSPA